MKQDVLATIMYSNDYDDTAFLPWQDGPWTGDVNGAYAVQKLYPYTKNIDICWDVAGGIPNFVGGRPMTGTSTGSYWGDWTVSGTLGWSNNGLIGPNGPRVFASQEHPSELMIVASCKDDPLGCFAFDSTQASCYNPNEQRGDPAQNAVGLSSVVWHNNQIPSGFVDGHSKVAKGMLYTAPNNDCDNQTYQWWASNSSAGNYTPNNDWSAHYLLPNVLNYWGTWWDGTE